MLCLEVSEGDPNMEDVSMKVKAIGLAAALVTLVATSAISADKNTVVALFAPKPVIHSGDVHRIGQTYQGCVSKCQLLVSQGKSRWNTVVACIAGMPCSQFPK